VFLSYGETVDEGNERFEGPHTYRHLDIGSGVGFGIGTRKSPLSTVVSVITSILESKLALAWGLGCYVFAG